MTTRDAKEGRAKDVGYWVRYATMELALLSFVVLIWVAAFHISLNSPLPTADTGDLAALLFGAASIALFILSLFVAILAMIGWHSLREFIRERVDLRLATEMKAVEERVDHLSTVTDGRLKIALGYLVGETSIDPTKLEPENAERLDYAIEVCKIGREVLRQAKAEKRHQLAALNNLTYYMAVRNRRGDADHLRSYAEELRREWVERGSRHFFLTYARVILGISNSQEETTAVAQILEDMVGSNTLPSWERKEAELYLGSLAS